MGTLSPFQQRAMASRWRRRQQCILDAGGLHPAVIRTIGAKSAFIETPARPPLGSEVSLRHPDAGEISGVIAGHSLDGVSLRLPHAAAAIAFALAAIAGDSSRP